jgi:hypothetical protein
MNIAAVRGEATFLPLSGLAAILADIQPEEEEQR